MRAVIRSLLVSLWFMLLTLPIMAIRVDVSTAPVTVKFDFIKVLYIGVGSFVFSLIWRAMLARKGAIGLEDAGLAGLAAFFRSPRARAGGWGALCLLIAAALLFLPMLPVFGGETPGRFSVICAVIAIAAAVAFFSGYAPRFKALARSEAQKALAPGKRRNLVMLLCFVLFAAMPLAGDSYQVNVLSSALLWVVLGLGLNIVVGQAGLLVLGYVAFYAVGAYSYAIINSAYGVGFWPLLPVGGLMALIFGLLLGFPVLRLKGDYLAIVTLGFGEIVRLVLENWSDLSHGAQGIDKIPRPGLFGLDLTAQQGIVYVYYLSLLLAVFTIFAVRRLRDSRLGRSWMALREDEIACEAMGIDKTTAKLSAFALSACWAGFGGVLFAAKTTYINPASFTFMESATILSVVVLGGLGSILGVILGAFIIVLLPESLRAFSEYRMLIFGASMVLMMVFRPQGLLSPERKVWKIHEDGADADLGGKA